MPLRKLFVNLAGQEHFFNVSSSLSEGKQQPISEDTKHMIIYGMKTLIQYLCRC